MSSAAGFRRVIARPAVVDAAVGAVVSGVLLAGVARPGFPLLRDWVATPTPPLSEAALGLGESAARAVPQDVAVVWATRALDAVGLPVWPLTGVLTALFCVWLAVAAGALVRRVVPGGRTAGEGGATSVGAGFWLRLPAVVGAVWNPFVVERLLQGHWSLLAAVAAVVSMPVLLARGRPRVAAACAALAAAGLTPTGWVLAVIAAAVALACGGRGAGPVTDVGTGAGPAGRIRAAVALAATAVVTALPWTLATALAAAGGRGAGTASGGADAAAGVAAFAARAEPGIGTLGSVVALGGIWNSEAVPPSRATWWAAAALLALLLVWALAARGLWRARRDPVVRATVPTALAAWLLVAAAATGPGLAALEALVAAVPGAGLLRDTQKFVALALPATVLALSVAARAIADRAVVARLLPARVRPGVAGALVTAVTVAAVPDAPRVLWEQLRPVTYGPGWEQVAGLVDGRPGDLLVLPAGSFRSTPLWAEGRPVLDPAPRLVDARVLVPGDLVVAGVRVGAGAGDAAAVPGEGDRARRATDALLRGADPRELADLGVRWVLDERTSAGPRGEAAETLTATTTRFSDPELTLHELAPPNGPGDADARWRAVAPPGAPAWARVAVLAAHALWLLTVAGAAVAAVVSGGPGRRSPR